MNWSDRLWDVVAFLITSGVLGLVFRPALYDFVITALNRRDSEVRKLVDRIYAKELEARATTAAMTEENHDSLAFMMESVKRQGAEMPKISEAVGKMTDAVDRLTKAVAKIEEGNSSLALSSARVEERLAAYERQRIEDRQNYRGPPKRASDQL